MLYTENRHYRLICITIATDVTVTTEQRVLRTLWVNNLTVRPTLRRPKRPAKAYRYNFETFNRYMKVNLKLLRKCYCENNDCTILVTIDIKKLCKSVSQNFGIDALTRWIEKHSHTLHLIFPKQFFLKSIITIVENDDCVFDDNFSK